MDSHKFICGCEGGPSFGGLLRADAVAQRLEALEAVRLPLTRHHLCDAIPPARFSSLVSDKTPAIAIIGYRVHPIPYTGS